MIKIILAFIFLSSVFFFGFKALHSMNKVEKWALTKYIVYSTLCGMLALGALTTFVILF